MEKYLKILKLAENFTNDTLGSVDPQGKCFTISFPLSLHLENHGIENSIIPGYFKIASNSHYWLTLENNEEIIIDPTIKQFCENMPSVYFGKKTENYKVEKNEDFEKWIDSVYSIWLNPFKFPLEFPHLDIKILLEVNIKTAVKINNEYEQMKIDINKSLKSKAYFRGIFEILKIHQNELESFLKLKGFDNLVGKARNNW